MTENTHYSEFIKYWALDKKVIYLNHGAFGACPIPILQKQNEYREWLEKEPVSFVIRELPHLWEASKSKLAEFINCDSEDLVFVPCATNGVNTVLKSLKFQKDDEILTYDHEYFACKNALDYVAEREGLKVVVAKVPFPLQSTDEAFEAIIKCITPKTKLVLIDHITSPTGLILPIPQIVKKLNEMGIESLIDGAHAPGMIPLDLKNLGATYYTGNCHKWLCSPKGAALLYVTKSRQNDIHPLSMSYNISGNSLSDWSQYITEFYWSGTYDPSAYLCIKDSIEFMESLLPGGWDDIMARNHSLALEGRKIICDALNMDIPCPDEMIGALASFTAPDTKFSGPLPKGYIDEAQNKLFKDFRIEVPFGYWPSLPKRVFRISAQIYNSIGQYKRLADCLTEFFK
jgi:isopenicillin-N epimerase